MKGNYNKDRTCCFTGHRVIPNEAKESLSLKVKDAVLEMYERGYRTFVGGGAIVFDTLAELTVIGLRSVYDDMKLVLAVPCANQDERWNFTQRAVYERVKKACDEVIVLHDTHTPGCMHERNDLMVDMSSACIAFYSGHPGGTRYTVEKCRDNGLYVVNLFENKKQTE